ncbi:MAG: CocE/NonD family hydrolase [Acidobacteriaceae bacterium]|nr:CocE/NonD family hydrolase [Acidobacteriaceae bacterium]
MRKRAMAGVMGAVLLGSVTAWVAGAQAAKSPVREAMEYMSAHAEKHEYRIPMRDGVKLYIKVWAPKDGFEDKGPYPILVGRTPYSCGDYGGTTGAPRVTANVALLKSGYILVCEDVRGRWASEGTWQEMTPSHDGKGVDESTDMYDTVDWLLKNVPNNNGKVGILGISYPGFYTAASIVDSHPAIKAASPQAPMTDLWDGDDSYHGGAFMLSANHSFYAGGFAPQKNPMTKEEGKGYEFPTQDMYQYYLSMGTLAHLDTPEGGTNPYFHDQVIHDTNDAYWKARNLAPHLHGVKAAVLCVGGWFDAEDLAGPVKVFHAIDTLSPEAAGNTLVEGPWVHGGWSGGDGSRLGDISFGSKTAAYYREQIEAPFFEHYLKGKPWDGLPKAYTFETGSNVWRKYDAWPPRNAVKKTLYFQPQGGLAWTAPAEAESKDAYVSDPAHPVPYTPYVTGPDVPQRYMDDDQRFARTRGDVLVYETAPLTEDVTFAGPVSPKLLIASTGTDADFDVKLIDVFPEDAKEPEEDEQPARGKRSQVPPVFLQGYEMLVRGEPFRAKFRDSGSDPKPLVPGKRTEVSFRMQDVNHTFRKGHRIMVQVQSSWFPLTDRNPQTFVDIAKAKPSDFVKATETVFHQKDAASGVEVLVVPTQP